MQLNNTINNNNNNFKHQNINTHNNLNFNSLSNPFLNQNPKITIPNFPSNLNLINNIQNPNIQLTSYKAEQMRNIDYFMNNIITNIANNNTDSIATNSIHAIQKMIDQQNEEGNPGLLPYLPLNTSTNNPELNSVNNVANNFGKIVDSISNYNNKNITHNNNVMSTVGNITGLLTNIYSDQEANKNNNNNENQNEGDNNSNNIHQNEDKKEEGNNKYKKYKEYKNLYFFLIFLIFSLIYLLLINFFIYLLCFFLIFVIFFII
jgi:hypothetical protein